MGPRNKLRNVIESFCLFSEYNVGIRGVDIYDASRDFQRMGIRMYINSSGSESPKPWVGAIYGDRLT
jgi:hypothetical protein